jgi:predicted deacetylase
MCYAAVALSISRRPRILTIDRALSLLLSVHDVSPRSEDAVMRLRDLIESSGGGRSLALLVVPNHWGEAPIRVGSPFAARLRRWAEQGDEIFLHGWSHRDTAAHARPADRLRARWMTAGEGEFLGLDHAEARRLMDEGRSLLEDITGRPLAGFVAPAWLYGDGELGFPLAEDHMRVWHPPTGTVLARGPVITWATRSRAREASSLLWAALSRRVLGPSAVVRIGVHPGDIDSTPVRASIAATIAHFAGRRRLRRYADLLGTLIQPTGMAGAR